MTPFGERLRALRAARNLTQQELAAKLGVSNAYLSALEHGRRGVPTFDLLQRIITTLGVIWDEADELTRLAGLSHPKPTIDTGGLSAEATELANLLAQNIRVLQPEEIADLLRQTRRHVREAQRASRVRSAESADSRDGDLP